MENVVISASDRETINKILFLMELTQAREHAYMKELIQQIESMGNQIKEMNTQLNELKSQIPQKKGIKDTVDNVYQNAVDFGKDLLKSLREIVQHIVEKGREWLEGIKQKGELKLYEFLDKKGIQEKLCAVQQKLNNGIEALDNGIKKLDSIENELRQSGSHLKNAMDIMKGTETVRHSEQKNSNVFSKVLRKVQNIYNGMLDKVNKAILAYDRLENSVASKNPSVLKKIGQFKDETKENNSGKRENNLNKGKQMEQER